MIPQQILKPMMSDDAVAELAGEFIDERHYDRLIETDCDIFKEDGSPLLHYRRKVVREIDAQIALKSLYDAATEYGNRGIAAGKLKYHRPKKNRHAVGEPDDAVRMLYKKRDGTLSTTNVAITVPSGIVGAFERVPRFPYCRLTKFTTDHIDRVEKALPYIRQVNDVFRAVAPERYANQMAACEQTPSDYIFKGTCFSTITVNKNWRTAVHTDAGDLKSGFGVLGVLSEGKYEGGFFILPKYRVAVNLRHRDVLLADVHEWHGNSQLIGVSKYWTRLSTVFYFRSKMVGCKPIQEELAIAKNRKPGQAMFFDFDGEFPE